MIFEDHENWDTKVAKLGPINTVAQKLNLPEPTVKTVLIASSIVLGIGITFTGVGIQQATKKKTIFRVF